MVHRFHVVLLVLILTAVQPAFAQLIPDPNPPWGVAGGLTFPFDNFGDQVSTGYGLHGVADYTLLPVLHACGDVGFHYFAGKDGRDDTTVWEVSAGFRFVLGAFFMGGEGAYYSEVDETNFVPSLGLRFTRWEVTSRWKAAGGSNWQTLRVGYYF